MYLGEISCQQISARYDKCTVTAIAKHQSACIIHIQLKKQYVFRTILIICRSPLDKIRITSYSASTGAAKLKKSLFFLFRYILKFILKFRTFCSYKYLFLLKSYLAVVAKRQIFCIIITVWIFIDKRCFIRLIFGDVLYNIFRRLSNV